ncbi:protein of unknown function SprT-like protein [Macrophomina phaseolina MS6]|uniref:SprT-like domain-containing protein n=1 Tax=Macrophomina phaseolina (strain MS6) TaxID=1126212 RepID=K2R8L3_MACPH|nr:protein of unknown function SprT-like protein [Macrophomina phaseolina MS6]
MLLSILGSESILSRSSRSICPILPLRFLVRVLILMSPYVAILASPSACQDACCRANYRQGWVNRDLCCTSNRPTVTEKLSPNVAFPPPNHRVLPVCHMARSNYESSDDELPALTDILARRRNAKSSTTTGSPMLKARKPVLPVDRTTLVSPISKETAGICHDDYLESVKEPFVQKAKDKSTAPRRQRLLKNPALRTRLIHQADPSTFGSIASLDDEDMTLRRASSSVKRTPARAAKKTARYIIELDDTDGASEIQSASDLGSESDSAENVETSLWCGSDYDESAEDGQLQDGQPLPPSTQEPGARNSQPVDAVCHRGPTERPQGVVPPIPTAKCYDDEHLEDVLATPALKKPTSIRDPCERPSSSSSADQNAVRELIGHHRTPSPPANPCKPGQASPSKKISIPTPPHGPSVDAFWSAEVVNTWNDQHSPRKVLSSPRKQQRLDLLDDKSTEQPFERKKSPVKRDPRRKCFEQRKHELAENFLKELDDTITQGQISSLSADCGGVKLVWSKTLNTTAGRANWKRETLKTLDNGTSMVHHRHYASIELAEKVIDDEDRLLNVIAHEFCHLANFMISNIQDNPHGKEFKEWGKKVTRAFGQKNINVTTKHTYTIDYKYIWACVSCGQEFKRHSKSIDPAKHRCGSCKAELAQIKPAVRQKVSVKRPSEYHIFMKENFQRIKRANEGRCHKDIMEILGKEYREHKAMRNAAAAASINMANINRAMETVGLDD